MLEYIKQGAKIWFKCYHSNKYPVTTFLHLDDVNETLDSIREPNAHSTLLDSLHPSHTVLISSPDDSDDVGHVSHIPRTPPKPTTYTIPLINKSIGTINDNENIFGLIKLGGNDVCYTNGTIEWVGRKRSFPINSGFKILNENQTIHGEPALKKVRRINKTFTVGNEQFQECDCADVLPTVNAIVDHLNALHEAVDIVDLRLTTIEDSVGN